MSLSQCDFLSFRYGESVLGCQPSISASKRNSQLETSAKNADEEELI